MRAVWKNPWIAGLWHAIVEIGKRWWNHNHSRSAAALAFYSLFSMVPMLVVSTAMAATMIGSDKARDELEQASGVFLDDGSSDYLVLLLEAQSDRVVTGWASLVGFTVLLFLASKVVVELREVLDLIFGKRHRKGRRGMVIGLVLGRAIPLLLVIALGGVLALSAIVGAVLHLVAERIDPYIPSGLGVWSILQQGVALVVVTLLFALILRWLPAKPPGFRPALGGALLACILLAVLRGLIGLYFERAGVTSFYGAAVTLVVLLLWIYFTIQIFFIGAEAAGYLDRRRLETGVAGAAKGGEVGAVDSG